MSANDFAPDSTEEEAGAKVELRVEEEPTIRSTEIPYVDKKGYKKVDYGSRVLIIDYNCLNTHSITNFRSKLTTNNTTHIL